MPLTVRRLLCFTGLNLSLLAGRAGLDHEVRWVAVSELVDPTPFLEGGELLLTTGMSLAGSAVEVRSYLDRVVGSGIVALGLGVGLTHDTAPSALVRAGERHGLPLLEVPRPTPFIAISKAVSSFLAAEQYEEVARAFDAHRELTRAALSTEGPAAVVRRLSRLIGGWVVLVRPSGAVVSAHPAEARGRVAPLAAELDRLRVTGLRASSAVVGLEEHASILPVGVRDRAKAFLVVGATAALSSLDRSLVNAAVSLLSLELEQGGPGTEADRRLRAGALRLLVASGPDNSRSVAAAVWGGLPEQPVLVMVAEGDTDARAALVDDLDEAGPQVAVAAELDDHTVGVLRAHDHRVERILAVRSAVAGMWLGVSEPVGLDAAGTGLEQARQILAAGRRLGRPVSYSADVAASGLLALVDVPAAAGLADAVLSAVERHRSGADLLASLRAYLAHNGQWDPAAHTLGVHRHTLRHRMGRVEQLLGRRLDDPDVRMELWFALQVRDRTRRAADVRMGTGGFPGHD